MKHLACIITLLTIWVLASKVFGESHYARRDEIPEAVLADAIGVLSIACPDFAIADPKFAEVARLSQRCNRIRTYKLENGTFEFEKQILLSATRPLTGWTYDQTTMRRYPVVSERGDYVKVVVDYTVSTATWISLKELISDEERTQRDVSYLRLVRDDSSLVYVTPVSVDPFFLSQKSVQRVYKNPNDQSRYDEFTLLSCIKPNRFSSDTYVLAKGRNVLKRLDYFYISVSAFQNGFAQLILRNGDPSEIPYVLGWVKVRDAKGNLTLWPVDYGC